MKFRITFIAMLAILLTACNMTLAEDITPPPGYVAPTPMPTLALYPAQPPSVENGKLIYVEKCAPCHGDTGLGDGEQGIQLGVTVRAFGLAEIARPASPAQYYAVVTRGNIERFMPPFNSLTDQERWDAVAYVMTLHTKAEEIEAGKKLFETNCAGCSLDLFKDQQKMSSFTEVELARIASQGGDGLPAFGSTFSEDELWAVAAYLRTLSFDTTPLATPQPLVHTQGTPASAASTSVAPEITPLATSQASTAGEATVTLQPGFGIVSGAIDNQTGADLPSGLVVTLRAYDHDANDPNAGPVETFSLEGVVEPDGAYSFENVEIPAGRIFLAELTYAGVKLQSEFRIVEEGAQLVSIPSLTIYALTEDPSGLVMDDAQVIFEYAADSIAVYTLYSFRNPTDEMIVVPQDETGQIPFIKFPKGSSGFGFEPTQDSATFLSTANGFAIPPSDASYGLVAFSSLAKTDEINFSMPFDLPIASVNVFVPVGTKVEQAQLTDLGIQTIQNFTYQIYESDSIAAGGSLAFTLTGEPSDAPAATSNNTAMLIGAGVLGAALLVAGFWMYRQDARKAQATEEEDAGEFESAEEVMDAIIALDDLRGKKKIGEQAYQKRRAELKEILRIENRE